MIVFSSLQIRRGVRVLLDNATATINPGQKVGLVGKNGCGKSTLLALLKNEISADGGSYTFQLATGVGESGNAGVTASGAGICH